MKKIAVIYKSTYGHTKKYAGWLAEELNADLLDAGKVKPSLLLPYDVIIYGGGLYAGGVNGFSLITKNFESLRGKAICLFTVGAADVSDRQNTDHIRSSLNRVLTPEMQEVIKIYHLRGGMDYEHMSLLHRTMMGMMRKMLHSKPESELRSEDKVMLASYGQNIDFTDRSSIASIIEDIKQLL